MSMDYIPSDDMYKTADLALAATLHLSYPVEALDRSDPQRTQFAFRRDEHLDEMLRQYWQRELKVDPQAYFQSLRILKARLYGAD